MNDLRDFLQLFTSIIAASVGLVLFWYNDTIPINEKIFITAYIALLIIVILNFSYTLNRFERLEREIIDLRNNLQSNNDKEQGKNLKVNQKK